ncbi:MAG: hypothetical protein AAB639_01670 [Patescibacteria group bacterium]
MKTGIIFILALAILSGTIYALFKKYSKSPSLQAQETAQNIEKFPDATSWQIKNSNNVCFSRNSCLQPVTVSFQTQKVWREIYFFYKNQMVYDGWTTKSIIVTSIPTSIVFTNNSDCKAELAKKDPFLSFVQNKPFNLFRVIEKQALLYNFSVTCPENPES